MPSLQDLERFRSSFRALGGEVETLARRGESFEDLELPESEGVSVSPEQAASPPIADEEDIIPNDADFFSLDDSSSPMTPTEEGGASPQEDAEAFDFGAFLDSIPDDLSGTPEPPPEGESSEAAPQAEEEPLPQFDMEAPPGSQEEESSAEEFDVPEGLLDGFADEVEAERASSTEPVGEETNEDEWALGDLDLPSDIGLEPPVQSGGGEEELGEEPSPAEPETPAEEAVDFGDFDFGDFSIPEEEGAPPAESAVEPGESSELDTPSELGEQASVDEDAFSLFSEEAPEVPDASAGGEGSESSPTPESHDFDFSIPDFQDESAPSASEPSAQEPSALEPSDFEPMPLEESFQESAAPEKETEESTDLPLDSFDMFSLDEDFMSSGFGVPKEKAQESAEESFAHLEDFSLEGIDDIFRGASSQEEPPAARKPASRAPVSAEVEEIVLSDEDFAKLEATLSSYPLNLRIACEELIAEHAVPPDQMSMLVRLLVRGAPARETAAHAARLIGRSIPIPRSFEKRTGEELEAERATFRYAFVHNILPVLKIFAFVAAIVTSVVYLGFEFIYTPLRAESYYKQGLERIVAGDYPRANERFDQGFRLRRVKKWFYKYAEGFSDARQYLLAEEKYDQLLKLYPRDKKGVLDYAAMESRVLRNYEKADRILRNNLLDYKLDDRDGLLAQGDNNLEWGEVDPARYEEARKSFARLMEKYGQRDEYLERMLLYFIRTDKLVSVLPLQEYFLSSSRRKISGSSLAELGGYLLDKKLATTSGVPDPNIQRIENLRELLDLAIEKAPNQPEGYYHLARYFEQYGKVDEELSAIKRAITAFSSAPELSAKRTGYRIDAYRRYGSLLVQKKEFLSAEEQLVEGLRLYEDALKRRVLSVSPSFGRLYADYGDIEYFSSGDLDAALGDYREAAKNGWSPPEIRYRMGYIHYAKRDWLPSVESFFDASSELPLNRRMLFALGNALYMRGDLNAAQGYYSRLLDLLETERSRFPVLVPNDRPEHAEIAERLMRARNNLGVTLEALAERSGDSRLRSRALALYSESARAWDALTRDPSTMVRSESTNLAFLNTKGSLYPVRDFEPQIYAEIDKDVLEPSTWEELVSKR